jgi:arylsulfatase A-like enzyme
VREPFIVYWKGHTKPGSTITDMISNLDVLPTIAAWTHAPLPEGRTLDGQSVSDVLLGKAGQHPGHKEIYYVNNGVCEAVRTGQWKYRLIKARQGDGINSKFKEATEELFNLDHDPSERTNLLQEFPGKAAELRALFEKFPGKTEN